MEGITHELRMELACKHGYVIDWDGIRYIGGRWSNLSRDEELEKFLRMVRTGMEAGDQFWLAIGTFIVRHKLLGKAWKFGPINEPRGKVEN